MDESLFIEACFSSSSFFQISEILAFLDYQIDCTNFYKVGITTAINRSSSTVKDRGVTWENVLSKCSLKTVIMAYSLIASVLYIEKVMP